MYQYDVCIRRCPVFHSAQAMPERVDAGTQSSLKRMVSKSAQYESIQLNADASLSMLHSHALANFLQVRRAG